MPEQFKANDVVQLKSGGQKMTISRMENNDQDAWCGWFDGKKLMGKSFAVGMLKHADDK